MRNLFVIPLLGILLTSASVCDVIYVDAAATGLNNGATWANAFTDLQDALAVAGSSAEVRIARGVYRPDRGTHSRTTRFVLRSGLALRGGYAGVSSANPDLRDPRRFVTILSGDIGLPASTGDNCYAVVYSANADGSASLDGLTLSGGQADGSYPNDSGGGLLISGGAPLVTRCIFRDNFAANSGAAVFSTNNGSPTFRDCEFLYNWSAGSGGAIAVSGGAPVISKSRFESNQADAGGGALYAIVSNLVVEKSTFIGNIGAYFGGAIHNYFSTSLISSCLFDSNYLTNNFDIPYDGGGALYHDQGSSLVLNSQFLQNFSTDGGGASYSINCPQTFLNCVFVDNYGFEDGGAIHTRNVSSLLVNCNFLANRTQLRGGAVYSANVALTVAHCTLKENRAFGIGAGGGIHCNGSTPQIRNSILWGNRNPAGTLEPAQCTGMPLGAVNYCCVQNLTGNMQGVGNIGADPGFVDPAGPDGVIGTADDNLRLRELSPCRDAGSSAFVPTDAWDLDRDGDTSESLPIDLDWSAREVYSSVDMGAFEYRAPGLLGDLNCDDFVDIRDLNPFSLAIADPAGYFAEFPNCSRLHADCNGDYEVNLLDVNAFIKLLEGAGATRADLDLVESAFSAVRE